MSMVNTVGWQKTKTAKGSTILLQMVMNTTDQKSILCQYTIEEKS